LAAEVGATGAGGGGGSSHIDNVNSGYGVIARTIPGNETMPTHNGAGTMDGNQGNGFAKITRIDPTNPLIEEIEILYEDIQNEEIEEEIDDMCTEEEIIEPEENPIEDETGEEVYIKPEEEEQ